ncbi:MAG: hypothetical protein WAV23_00800 [Minisyncoccia bacterium]
MEGINKKSELHNSLQRKVELASKYNKGDELPVDFKKIEGAVGMFDILLEGEKVGTFEIADTNPEEENLSVKTKQLGFIRIDDLFLNKGLGKQFYIVLNNYLKNTEDSVLESSGEHITPQAKRVWASLLKDGLVYKEGTRSNGEDFYRFK